MRRLRQILLFLGLYVCRASLLPAQQNATAPDTAAAPVDRLRLFLDCSDFFCDPDYYRTELSFVDHVRDRRDADVHLLITTQRTGSGGTEYTLRFVGQRAFEGRTEELRYAAPPNATEVEQRVGLLQRIKLGLAPYLARTAQADQFQLTFSTPGGTTPTPAASAHDPWNLWTFRVSGRGFFNGEQHYSSRDLNGSLSASRTSELWKIELGLSGSESVNRFDVSDTTTIKTRQTGYGLNGLMVKSLSSHWSAGARASASSSTFLNQDLSLRLAPALEYDVFPYSESTRRQLTLQYSLGLNTFQYDEETIFGRTEERLVDESLLTSLSLKQKWGSVSLSTELAHYFNDPSHYRGVLFGNAEVRLFRGLSLDLFGSTSYLRDQLYLPKGDATPEEVLLRLRQLDTSYRYFGSVGMSYTFGSIYNNVVNPRFSGSNGGFVIIN